ncbi:MAG: hypothetical protein ACJ8R9_32680 [Steroidobacteraceae bacterium]
METRNATEIRFVDVGVSGLLDSGPPRHTITGSRIARPDLEQQEPPVLALAAETGGNFASATSLDFPGIIGRTYLLSVNLHF